MARRWEGRELTESLQSSRDYTPEELADLVTAARTGPMGNPQRADAEKRLLVLLRLPNYFEDLGQIANAGKLERKLVSDFAGVAFDEWSLWKLAVEKLREKDDQIYVEFERLADEGKPKDGSSAAVGPSSA